MTVYIDAYGKEHKPSHTSIIKPRQGVFSICISQGHILLSWPKHCPTRPELPGGGIEEGEDIKEALFREIYEETNVHFQPIAPLQEYKQTVHYYADDVDEYMDYQQTFWLLKGDAIDDGYFEGTQSPEDAFESAWIPLEVLGNLDFHKIHKRAFFKIDLTP